MNKMNLKLGLIALAGLGLSVNVSATDLTCSDITFNPSVYETYEMADQACLDVVDRDGGTYVKLTARVVSQLAGGTRIRFLHSDGEFGAAHKANLPRDFQTMIGGKSIALADLAPTQEMNVYISNAYWTVPMAEVAEVMEEAVAPPPPPPPAPEPEPEPEPEMLPTTASSLPLLALFGSLFLVLGGALRLSRKQ